MITLLHIEEEASGLRQVIADDFFLFFITTCLVYQFYLSSAANRTRFMSYLRLRVGAMLLSA